MHTSNHTCKSRVISLFIFLFATVSCSSAFIVTTRTTSRRTSTSTIKSTVPIPGSTILHMAGFGGGSSNSKNKKKNKKNTPQKKTSTLKPKQQWDRYAKNLKAATAFKVGVRVVNDDSTDNDTDTENENKWLETGKVKSDNNESTEIAVAMQRGIIAEHSKRLYPLKVLPKDKVEWAFSTSFTPEQADWTLINVKDVAQNAPSGIEKIIGFEGKPDPASGFYCHYEGGRLVDRYSGEGSVD